MSGFMAFPGSRFGWTNLLMIKGGAGHDGDDDDEGEDEDSGLRMVIDDGANAS